MNAEETRKLLGGYAAGTLTEDERQALLVAALDDQKLFDDLARDEALRELLSDPAARAHLLAALDEPAPPWSRRLSQWMWGHAVGLAAVGCFAMAAGYFAWQARFANPDTIRLHAVEPTTVEVTAEAPKTHRPFDLPKTAPTAVPALPAPPALIATNRQPGLPAILAGTVAPVAAPSSPPAGRAVLMARGEAAGANAVAGDTAVGAAAPPRLAAAAVGGLAGAGGGGRGGAGGGAPIVAPEQVVVTAQATPAQALPFGDTQVVQQVQPANVSVRGAAAMTAFPDAPVAIAADAVAANQTDATAWKFAPAIAALAARARSGTPLTPEDTRIVVNGEANVRLTLTNYSADSLAQLRSAGLTITKQDSSDVTGHIAPAKLDSLTKFPFVMWIGPR
jgi:hypothetical protein